MDGWQVHRPTTRVKLSRRSQRHPASHLNPLPPSPNTQRGNAAARAAAGDKQQWAGGEGKEGEGDGGERPKWRDHVNALGLPNDGYDYGRHLKRMGA